jgi:hypothetical protein
MRLGLSVSQGEIHLTRRKKDLYTPAHTLAFFGNRLFRDHNGGLKMKALKALIAALALAGTLGGCAYGGIATAGDNVVITRNDAFLFGALRKVFVCKVTPQGVTQCSAADAP